MPTISDVMTKNPVAVPEDTSVRDALALLEPLEIRHLPVTDDRGVLRGLVSERDLRGVYTSRRELAGNWAAQVREKLDEPVSRVMIAQPVTLAPEAPVEEAIARMVDERIGAIPVVRDGVLVGIVSYVDVLRAVLRYAAA